MVMKCPNCGEAISDKTDRCAHCGRLLERDKETSTNALIIMVIIVIITMVGGFLIINS